MYRSSSNVLISQSSTCLWSHILKKEVCNYDHLVTNVFVEFVLWLFLSNILFLSVWNDKPFLEIALRPDPIEVKTTNFSLNSIGPGLSQIHHVELPSIGGGAVRALDCKSKESGFTGTLLGSCFILCHNCILPHLKTKNWHPCSRYK